MKTNVIPFVLGFLISASTVLIAGPEFNPPAAPRVAVTNNGQNLRVIYESDDLCDVRISIQNDAGQEVFREQIRNRNGFIRPYDLNALPQGEYTVKVEDESLRYASRITLSSSNYEQNLVAHIARVGHPDENKFMVAIPNIDNRENRINVQIMRGNTQLLYDKTISVIFPKAIVYKITDMPPGDEPVTIQVKDQTGAVRIKTF